MKILKTLGCICASCVLLMGIMTYSVLQAAKDLAIETTVDEVIDQITKTALTDTSSLLQGVLPEKIQQQVTQGVIDQLPEDVQENLDSLKEEIAKDAQMQEISEKYMDAILAGAIDGTSELPDLNQDVKNVIEEKLPEVVKLTGKEISTEQVSAMAEELINKTNLQECLEESVQQVHASLSPSQKQMLSLFRMLQNDSLLYVSYAMIIISILAIVFLTFSPIKWMLYGGIVSLLSGGFLWGGSAIASMLVGDRLAQIHELLANVKDTFFAALSSSGIFFAGIGIALLIVYTIIVFVKDHVVYE